MRRRVIGVNTYYESMSALDDSDETTETVEKLALRAAEHGEHGRLLPGVMLRALKSRPYGRFPPLRLLYGLDEDTVYLLHICLYDPLADDDPI